MFEPEVKAFFDRETWTVSYLVSDPKTGDTVAIDPVLNYDAIACQTSPDSVEEMLAYVSERKLTLRGVLETHAHADHLSGARYLAAKRKVPVGIGAGIAEVQGAFKKILNLGEHVAQDGSQFDLLLEGNNEYAFGSLSVRTLSTPGHTPACLSYWIGDSVFTGDSLFMEDYGTGRTDFPAGSSEALYHSVHEVLYSLPANTRVFVGHDYQPGGRELRYESSIAKQRESNVQLNSSTTKEQFVEFRDGRDRELRAPRLIFQSIQVNAFGGYLPEPESNGATYLKSPLNLRRRTDSSGHLLDVAGLK